MLLPPFSSPKNFSTAKILGAEEEKDSLWFIFAKEELLVCSKKKEPLAPSTIPLTKKLYLGTFENKALFAAEWPKEHPVPQEANLLSLRSLHGILSPELSSLAGRALQLLHWDRTHSFCGCCGEATFPRKEERCRECPSCGQLFYPKITPAVLVLIRKNDRILLAKSRNAPGDFYTLIAGFVEGGETLEQCVAREVEEEVGLQVSNIRYFGSQPWPLSYSLLVGFTCDWRSGDISPDLVEIEEACWFPLANLPSIPPPLSLAWFLIQNELSSQKGS